MVFASTCDQAHPSKEQGCYYAAEFYALVLHGGTAGTCDVLCAISVCWHKVLQAACRS